VISKLDKIKEDIFSLYEKGNGTPEIKKILNLNITERSIQRYLRRQGKIRTLKEALSLSEERRIRTIREKWRNHRKLTRRVLNPKRRYKIMERDNFTCRLCGSKAGGGVLLEIDHINSIPSDNRDDNLQVLCYECNVGKYHNQVPVYNPVVKEHK
jgi:5-methylcytosine-specific restriction endonuclease McrA